MSATESESTATSKENDSKMYTRKFDLEDEEIRLKAPTYLTIYRSAPR